MIKVGLVNGSPKSKESVSGYLLTDLKDFIKDAEITEYSMNKPEVGDELPAVIKSQRTSQEGPEAKIVIETGYRKRCITIARLPGN